MSNNFFCFVLFFFFFWETNIYNDYTVYGPRPIGPWALARMLSWNILELKSNSKPISFDHMLDKPMLIRHGLVEDILTRNSPWSRQLGIGLGSITAEQSIGGWNQFQCHYHCFQWSLFLVRNNQIGPHSHEWDQNVIMSTPPTSSYK